MVCNKLYAVVIIIHHYIPVGILLLDLLYLGSTVRWLFIGKREVNDLGNGCMRVMT